MIVVDAGYKTPAIAKTLIDDNIEPLFPYKRPMTKKGYMRKKEYVYDESLDVYICPELKILKYSSTDKNGYRIYKSSSNDCMHCKYLDICTKNKLKQTSKFLQFMQSLGLLLYILYPFLSVVLYFNALYPGHI